MSVKKLGPIAFIKTALTFFTDPKAAAGGTSFLALLILGGGYIVQATNEKYAGVIAEIKQNTALIRKQDEKIQAAQLKNEKILVTLVAIKDSVNDVKSLVRDTRTDVRKATDRIWVIARDVDVMKRKQK